MQKDNTWTKYSEEQAAACDSFCLKYMDFLSKGKTERECVELIKSDIEAAGYRPLDDYIAAQKPLQKGAASPFWTHTIMAALRSISGSRFPWRCTVSL